MSRGRSYTISTRLGARIKVPTACAADGSNESNPMMKASRNGAVTMQLKRPLTPALSPSEGAREKTQRVSARSLNGDTFARQRKVSLAPSEGERAGVRGRFNCIVTG